MPVPTQNNQSKSIRVVLDANIYLSFYQTGEGSLKSLEELGKLIDKDKVTLLLPQQVLDEFNRNKPGIIQAHYLELIKSKPTSVGVAVMMKGLSETERILQSYKKLATAVTNLADKYKKRSLSNRSKINKLILNLFSKAELVEHDDSIVQTAYVRYLKGNPPRKGRDDLSYGDGIIWETLLANYSIFDLVIISADHDWEDLSNEGTIHPFLASEWKKKGSKMITLYPSLGRLINKIKKAQTIEPEEICREERASAVVTRIISTSPSASADMGMSYLNNTLSVISFEGRQCTMCGNNFYDNFGIKTMVFRINSDCCENCNTKYGYTTDYSVAQCNKCCRNFYEKTDKYSIFVPAYSPGISSAVDSGKICPLCRGECSKDAMC
ncbi:MAG: PIN domain-containing protein [Patescibacteria group bacterium]|jgi:hypothetical protein